MNKNVEHWECDCVPNLGPSHCHACGDEVGHPVPWAETWHVRVAEIAARAEADRERIEDLIGQTAHGDGIVSQALGQLFEDRDSLLSEVRRLRSVVEDAPHAENCHSRYAIGFPSRDYHPCDCWKSTYQAGADHE